MSFARVCLALGVLATSVWCSAETLNPRSSGAPVLRFALPSDGSLPDIFDVPWPSDIYLQDGHIVERIPGFSNFVQANDTYVSHELARLDGFSRFAMASFVIDDEGAPKNEDGSVAAATIDPASLPASENDCMADSSSVFLIDLAAGEPGKARIPCRAEYHDDRPFGSLTRPTLAVGPARGIVLEEGHPYAAVVTARVKDTNGRNITASPSFASARDAAGFWGEKTKRAQALLGRALDGTEIVGIAPYTTHTRARELYDLRDALEQMPVPKLGWDAPSVAPMAPARFSKTKQNGFTATLDEWLGIVDPKNKLPDGSDDPSNDLPVRAHDAVGAFGTAAFEANYYLVDKPGGYPTLDHATFARDANGKIVPTRTQRIWVSFAVPNGAMPQSGWPAVIVQHGLSSSREYVIQLMNTINAAGFMAIAIDSITFGARAPEPELQIDAHTDYENAPGATYKGPDGIADDTPTGRNGPFDLFGGLANLGAFRDQLRHAAIDTSQLVRVLRSNPDLSPLATDGVVPRIDPDRIGYLGESLGSIEGEIACAIEPNLRAWFFSVGGGGFILEAATHGPALGSYVGAGAGLKWRFLRDHFTESHPFINMVQTLIEPADPLTYAPDLVKHPRAVAGRPASPRNIILLEVLWDELVANEASEAFARGAGLGLATPNVGSNAGIVDLVDFSKNTQRVPLPDVFPDATGTIHDAPMQGVTAVVVQASPAGHGYDLVRRDAKRSYAAPYLRKDQPAPFVSLSEPFWVKNPYRELDRTVTDYFASAFSRSVPRTRVLAPPVRDFDDDGVTDDKDRFPSDPKRN